MKLRNWLQRLIKFLNRPISLKWISSTTTQANPIPNCHSSESGNPSTSDDYLPFLRPLLQLEINSNSDPKVVYPFLARHTDKLNLTFAATAQQWFHSQLDPDNSRKNQNLARNFGNLANKFQQFPLGSPLNNLEIAITLYQAALEVYTREAYPEQWADTQNNLGEAFRNRIFGERRENLEIAITLYQQALEVRTREAFPEKWADTQNNLAAAYSGRICGERRENLEIAIGCCQQALEVRTREAFPEKWADTQNNLAAAYSGRICGERRENLEMAIGCYQQALEVRTREAFPEKWADTQNNLAAAYSDRICGERRENLEMAIGCYQQALEVRTREAFPEKWADTQNNLAAAYSDRICGERRENLEMAIGCYQQALEVRTREAFPEKWADTQNNLAAAYSDRICGERRENLEMAIGCYQQALEVRTREAFPEKWADTQNNLAAAYYSRICGERRENLEMAIASHYQALEVRTREAFPEKWADTQNNLANAYYSRICGERRENLEMAIGCYQQALAVYTCEAFPEKWAMTQNNLAIAYRNRIKGERGDNLEQAIRYFQAALEVRTRQAFPEKWAETQNNLAVAYSDRIKGERRDNLEQAIRYYQAALEVYTREAYPEQWAGTQNNLANAYYSRIKGERGDNLEQAIRYYQAALEVYTRQAFPEQWAMTQNNLGYTYQDIGDIDAAIAAYQLALAVRTPTAFPLNCLTTGRNLGNLGYDRQNWEIAICGYDNAIRAVEQSRNWATSPQTKRQILEDALDIYGKMIQACIHLERYDQALLTVERSKSRTLMEMLTSIDLIPKNATPEQQQRYRQLSREIAALQQSFGDSAEEQGSGGAEEQGSGGAEEQGSGGNSHDKSSPRMSAPETAMSGPYGNELPQLKQLLQQRDELLAEINDPEFNAIQTVAPELPDFTQILTPETALIEWYLPQNRDLGGYVFIVTLKDNRHHIQVHHYTAKQRQALDQFNQTYFSDFRELTWYEQIAPRLQELAQLLDLDALLGKIPPTCHSLILVPHLYLHLFPLHGLAGCGSAGEQGSRGAGENFSPLPLCPSAPLPLQDLFPDGIRYAPSCQILGYIQNRQQPGTPPNPPFKKGGTGQQFFAVENPTEDLPYTEMEVEFIRQSFDPSTYILKNAAATKAALNSPETLAKLRESFFVHFSCHGGFDSKNPLDSALILAGGVPPNSEGRRTLTLRDGRSFDTEYQGLTLREIYANLELSACRLVMLSACETGLLSSQLTDEYVGLVSGFLHAGSPSVVSSFWCVDDVATAFLSIKFYQEFTPETTVAKALKSAQNWVKTRTKSDLLAWCADCLKMTEDEMDEMEYLLMDYDDIPFADMRYWLAFFASGL